MHKGVEYTRIIMKITINDNGGKGVKEKEKRTQLTKINLIILLIKQSL